MDDDTAKAVMAAARNAKRAAALALICTIVAVFLLAIDNSIKKAIVDKAVEAHRLLDEASAIVRGAASGTQGTGQDGTATGPGIGAADDVVQPAGPSAAPAGNAGNGRAAARGRAGSRPGRPLGDG